jgi:UvrD-like helicase C-terminal domain
MAISFSSLTRVRRLRQFRPDREHRGRDAGNEKIPFPTDPKIRLASDIPDQPFVETSLETASRSSPGIISKRRFPAGKSTTAPMALTFSTSPTVRSRSNTGRGSPTPTTTISASLSHTSIKEGELIVDFDDCEVTYGFGELDELVLADVTTIHKNQGSEYPAVVIPLTTHHYPMLQRNLV